ncbi:MAG: hypothetical protein ACR2GH_04575 [Pseudonocardia sp.]
MRTQPCDAVIRRGRLRKAEQFGEAAAMVRDLADEDADVADAYVTLCVHAGIAASDVICCARLGKHAQGEKHNEAVDLLKTADKEVAKHLSTLLNLKTKSGYSHTSATVDEFRRAGRAAEALVEAARRAHAST